jgi:hypothetical protein
MVFKQLWGNCIQHLLGYANIYPLYFTAQCAGRLGDMGHFFSEKRYGQRSRAGLR